MPTQLTQAMLSTIDGLHPTDIGMVRWADAVVAGVNGHELAGMYAS